MTSVSCWLQVLKLPSRSFTLVSLVCFSPLPLGRRESDSYAPPASSHCRLRQVAFMSIPISIGGSPSSTTSGTVYFNAYDIKLHSVLYIQIDWKKRIFQPYLHYLFVFLLLFEEREGKLFINFQGFCGRMKNGWNRRKMSWNKLLAGLMGKKIEKNNLLCLEKSLI